MLCQEILKELKCIERIRDHKVIDIWLLMLIYMNGESLQKSVEKIFKKKIIEGCIHEAMVDQCIGGNMELVQVCISFIHLEKKNFFCGGPYVQETRTDWCSKEKGDIQN